MATSGRAVVVATHRLDEVTAHANHVSVMRGGRLVASRSLEAPDEAAARAIARDVMGGDEAPPAPRAARPLGDVRLELRDARRAPGLHGVTLRVRAGEIVGIAGVDGNGQREIVSLLTNREPPDAGQVRAEGVAAVYEDRTVDGLVLDASVRDNLVLGELGSFTRFGVVDAAALDREARARLERAGVDPRDPDTSARALSGGNQQKIVVARALARAPRVGALVFAQPTRGVDRAAAAAIHDAIVRAASDGKAVLVVSADTGELRSLCDRVLVVARGRIAAELPPDAPESLFGEAMMGTSSGDVPT
jgi:simple sugar transport system ATP-binding protein